MQEPLRLFALLRLAQRVALVAALAQQREELLELRQLEVEYAAGVRSVRAVDGIDLEIARGETLLRTLR